MLTSEEIELIELLGKCQSLFLNLKNKHPNDAMEFTDLRAESPYQF